MKNKLQDIFDILFLTIALVLTIIMMIEMFKVQ